MVGAASPEKEAGPDRLELVLQPAIPARQITTSHRNGFMNGVVYRLAFLVALLVEPVVGFAAGLLA